VAITFYAIYRQLRTQRSASAFEQAVVLESEWSESGFVRDRLEFLLEIEGREVAGWLPPSGDRTASWFDRLGHLVAHGDIELVDAYRPFGIAVTWWWAVLGPYVARQRAESGWVTAFESFEDLERRMQRFSVQHMGKPWVEPTTITQMIDAYTARLRRAQDAAQGIIPTRKATTPQAPGD
jgi:hypothetical protein